MRTGVGGDRFRSVGGEFSVQSEFEAEGRGEAFVVRVAAIGAVRCAIDNYGKDSVFSAEAFEIQYLLIDPETLGGARRADNDEGAGLFECFLNGGSQASGSGEFLAVA